MVYIITRARETGALPPLLASCHRPRWQVLLSTSVKPSLIARSDRAMAADIAARARKVRIPGKSPKRWKVLNYLTPEGAFSHFEVIEAQTACDRVSAKTRVTDFIDLSLPHRLKSYDKKGGKRLIKGLKYQLYGRTNVRLTKRRCEEFFADPGNLAKQRYWLELTGWAGL
jgi:hypothetical protein